jgi:quercetin dioxygenase-like cupin family protein
MSGFVIRDWRLLASEGDQAPLHVHHGGEQAFIRLDGQLQVEAEQQPDDRRTLPPPD